VVGRFNLYKSKQIKKKIFNHIFIYL